MLELIDVDVAYGEVQVIWSVSAEVEEGVLTALIGPNGAGKSTLQKTVAGLVNPSAGEITLNGERIDTLKTFQRTKRGLVAIPEGKGLFNSMSVYENLLVGSYTPRAKKKRDENLAFAFDLFPRLKERQDQSAGSLSGGEKQMLAIARGLMGDPQVLLMDEPSLGLAPHLVTEVFDTIESLPQEGITLLLAEQMVERTLSIATEGYLLENGRIARQGPGKELLEEDYIQESYLGV